MAHELTIITHAYDLLAWTLPHTAKFPRSHRHGLGMRLEERLHQLLDLLVEAKLTADKGGLLRAAHLQVEHSRLLFRLAKDLRLLSLKSHEHAARQLDTIGRQLGGWRRQQSSPA